MYKLPERGGGEEGEVVGAMPERKHSFFGRCSLIHCIRSSVLLFLGSIPCQCSFRVDIKCTGRFIIQATDKTHSPIVLSCNSDLLHHVSPVISYILTCVCVLGLFNQEVSFSNFFEEGATT